MKKFLILFFCLSFCPMVQATTSYITDAMKKGDYYKSQRLYDNAIIWYQRAAEERERLYGNSGYIPVDIADTYLLKGNCDKPFDLYRQAFNNVMSEHITNAEWAAPQIENKIEYADRYCTQYVWSKRPIKY